MLLSITLKGVINISRFVKTIVLTYCIPVIVTIMSLQDEWIDQDIVVRAIQRISNCLNQSQDRYANSLYTCTDTDSFGKINIFFICCVQMSIWS